MVDRKMYSRSRQKAFLNRVVDEELYKPESPQVHRRGRGISELLNPDPAALPEGHPRNRVAGFMEPSPRPARRIVPHPEPEKGTVPAPPAAKPEGFLTRLWRRLGSLVPGLWS